MESDNFSGNGFYTFLCFSVLPQDSLKIVRNIVHNDVKIVILNIDFRGYVVLNGEKVVEHFYNIGMIKF